MMAEVAESTQSDALDPLHFHPEAEAHAEAKLSDVEELSLAAISAAESDVLIASGLATRAVEVFGNMRGARSDAKLNQQPSPEVARGLAMMAVSAAENKSATAYGLVIAAAESAIHVARARMSLDQGMENEAGPEMTPRLRLRNAISRVIFGFSPETRVQINRKAAAKVVLDAFKPEPWWQSELRVRFSCLLTSFVGAPVAQIAASMKSQFARNRFLRFPVEAGVRDGILAPFTGPARTLFRLAAGEGWRGVFCGVGWRVAADTLLWGDSNRISLEGASCSSIKPSKLALTALLGLIAVPLQACYYRCILGCGMISSFREISWGCWFVTPACAVVDSISTSGVQTQLALSPVSLFLASVEAILYATSALSESVDRGHLVAAAHRIIYRGATTYLMLLPYQLCAWGLSSAFTDFLFDAAPIRDQRNMCRKVRSDLDQRDKDKGPLQTIIQAAQQQRQPLHIEGLCIHGLSRVASGGLGLVRSLSNRSGGSGVTLLRTLSRVSGGAGTRVSDNSERPGLLRSLSRSVSRDSLGSANGGWQRRIQKLRSLLGFKVEEEMEGASAAVSQEQELSKGLEEKRKDLLKYLKEAFNASSDECEIVWREGDEVAVIHGVALVPAVLESIDGEEIQVRYHSPVAARHLSRNRQRQDVLHLGPSRRIIHVRRSSIETALSEIGSRKPTELLITIISKAPPRMPGGIMLHSGFLVKFEGEEAQDYGGVRREFFEVLGKELVHFGANDEDRVVNNSLTSHRSLFSRLRAHSKLFSLQRNRTLLPAAFDLEQARSKGSARTDDDLVNEHHTSLVALGRALALAAVYSCPCPVPLSRFVYKLLVGKAVDPSDIRSLDKEIWERCLEPLLIKDGLMHVNKERAELFLDPLTFVSISTGEALIDGGTEQQVTETCLEEYLRLVCQDFLIGSAHVELGCMLRGFWEILPCEVLKKANTSPDELELLVNGLSKIDVDSWERHSKKEGRTDVIAWFFELLREADVSQRALILAFATGSSRLPPGGFEGLNGFDGRPAPFCISAGGNEDALPTAHTCFNQIVLPPVTSKDELNKRLGIALDHGGGGMFII